MIIVALEIAPVGGDGVGAGTAFGRHHVEEIPDQPSGGQAGHGRYLLKTEGGTGTE